MAKSRPVTPAEEVAIAAFLAMDMHVMECWVCGQVEQEFRTAAERNDMEAMRRLSPRFCGSSQKLAEEFEAACRAAFGNRVVDAGREG